MDKAVARSGGKGHAGVRGAEFWADVLGGFSDDLDEHGQGQPEQLVVVEIRTLLVPGW
ncbi:MAG: hypothetical protein L0H64_01160 [Pseudonocardia sp.]|nr:hypothetical protein [Pseudonocardia sp.]